MFTWLLKAPGLLRTVSAVLATSAVIAQELVQDVDLSQGLTKATLFTGVLALLRAVTRKSVNDLE